MPSYIIIENRHCPGCNAPLEGDAVWCADCLAALDHQKDTQQDHPQNMGDI